METFLLWVLFSILVGAFGKSRDYGFWSAFLFSLLLSPLIGLIIVLLSDRPTPKREHKWEIFDEEAKRAEFKGEFKLALDKYLDSLYHLKNDYSDLEKWAEKQRQDKIQKAETKIAELKRKVEAESELSGTK